MIHTSAFVDLSTLWDITAIVSHHTHGACGAKKKRCHSMTQMYGYLWDLLHGGSMVF